MEDEIDKSLLYLIRSQRKSPAKLTNYAAKSIFRLMGGILDQFLDFEATKCFCKKFDGKKICDLCSFNNHYLNLSYNLKPLELLKSSETFLSEAHELYKSFNEKFDGRDPMKYLDEYRFFAND